MSANPLSCGPQFRKDLDRYCEGAAPRFGLAYCLYALADKPALKASRKFQRIIPCTDYHSRGSVLSDFSCAEDLRLPAESPEQFPNLLDQFHVFKVESATSHGDSSFRRNERFPRVRQASKGFVGKCPRLNVAKDVLINAIRLSILLSALLAFTNRHQNTKNAENGEGHCPLPKRVASPQLNAGEVYGNGESRQSARCTKPRCFAHLGDCVNWRRRRRNRGSGK
jgi:hypothetical protein